MKKNENVYNICKEIKSYLFLWIKYTIKNKIEKFKFLYHIFVLEVSDFPLIIWRFTILMEPKD